jgi:hypothetical protein
MSCALCLKDEKLCKSHIYPEFLYDRIYDDDHTYRVLTTRAGDRAGKRPKGIYEKLLCRECETLLSKWETHASQVLFGGTELEMVQESRQLIVDGIDYVQFKLFQMSLLWRTAVSSRKEVPDISLGPHEERMREMLISQDPGPPYKYGCMMFFVPDYTETLSGGLFPPDAFKMGGHRCYRCIFAGLFWVYFVSSHTHEIPYDKLMLSTEGRLPVSNAGKVGKEYLVELAGDFRSSNKDLFDRL